MNSLLLYFVCGLLPIFIIYKQRKCWYFIWQLNGWLGLVQQPILWLLLIIYLEPKSIMTSIQRCSKYFQFPLAIIVFNRILLYVDDPGTMESVLTAPECLNKTFLQNGFYANKGLLHAKDENWKERRKQLNPAFSHNTLVSFFGVFNRAANELKWKIYENLQGDQINFKDIEDLVTRTILDVSCLTTMGFTTNFIQNDEKCIARAYRYLMELTALRILKPWYQIDFIFRLLDNVNYEKSKKANKLVQEFVENIVQQKHTEWEKRFQQNAKGVNITGTREQLPEATNDGKLDKSSSLSSTSLSSSLNKHIKNENVATMNSTTAATTDANGALQNIDAVSLPATTADAFMQHQQRIFIDQIFYLAQTGKLTLQDIMNESQSMVVVSFETVSTCIINALLCLAINHECQMKLRHEIQQILSKRKRKMSKKRPIKHNNGTTNFINVTHDDEDVNVDDDGEVDMDLDFDTATDDDWKDDANDDDDDDNVKVTMEHLQSMPYLDMIINESLRLLTTVPMNLRNVSTDFQLNIIQRDKETNISNSNSNSSSKSDSNNSDNRKNSCSYRCRRVVVPKDSMIALDTFNMQRNKEYWGENALNFYPEHFSKKPEEKRQQHLDEMKSISSSRATETPIITASTTTTSRHSYAFIPFSKGLRTCIGYRYSMYLSKIILIRLISSFAFTTNIQLKDLQYYEGVSLKYRNSENIQFQIHSIDG